MAAFSEKIGESFSRRGPVVRQIEGDDIEGVDGHRRLLAARRPAHRRPGTVPVELDLPRGVRSDRGLK